MGASATSLVAADLDQDGITDLIATNVPEDHVTVLTGQGDGRFAARTHHSGFLPAGAAVALLDGDHRPDLAVANHKGDNVTVLLAGLADTSSPIRLATGEKWPVAVAAEDLDDDGDPDLLVSMKRKATVAVFRNDDGALAAAGRYGTGGHSLDIAVGHLDQDEHPDAVAPLLNQGEVLVLLGKGDGEFRVADPLHTGDPTALAIADFDGDGANDVAIANGAVMSAIKAMAGRVDATEVPDGTVSVFLGAGDGGFRSHAVVEVGKAPRSLAAGDLDEDGFPDLVVANALSHDISVLRNRGSGAFTPTGRHAAGRTPTFVGLWDLNRDGHLDMLSTSAADGQLLVWYGVGDGTFRPPVSHAVGKYPVAVAAGDLDDDGRVDIVVANKFSDDLSVLRGGEVGLLPQEAYASDFPVGVALADMDGDGDLDLVVSNEFVNQVVMLRNRMTMTAPAENTDSGE
jgi:hypothetical protein